MSDLEIKEYFAIYTDAWKFFHKFVEGVKSADDEDGWTQCRDEAIALENKYPNHSEFVAILCSEAITEINKIKNRKE